MNQSGILNRDLKTSFAPPNGHMPCILSDGCAHMGKGRCEALEQCGADYALNKARSPDGYEVEIHDNKTADALLRAGLITKHYVATMLIRAI